MPGLLVVVIPCLCLARFVQPLMENLSKSVSNRIDRHPTSFGHQVHPPPPPCVNDPLSFENIFPQFEGLRLEGRARCLPSCARRFPVLSLLLNHAPALPLVLRDGCRIFYTCLRRVYLTLLHGYQGGIKGEGGGPSPKAYSRQGRLTAASLK